MVLTIEEIREVVEGVILCDDNNVNIERAMASDLMSDVLAFAEPGIMLITGLHSPQVIRTALVVGIPVVLMVRKIDVPESVIDFAKESGVTLIATKLSMFETCGRLYMRGIKPARREME